MKNPKLQAPNFNARLGFEASLETERGQPCPRVSLAPLRADKAIYAPVSGVFLNPSCALPACFGGWNLGFLLNFEFWIWSFAPLS